MRKIQNSLKFTYHLTCEKVSYIVVQPFFLKVYRNRQALYLNSIFLKLILMVKYYYNFLYAFKSYKVNLNSVNLSAQTLNYEIGC